MSGPIRGRGSVTFHRRRRAFLPRRQPSPRSADKYLLFDKPDRCGRPGKRFRAPTGGLHRLIGRVHSPLWHQYGHLPPVGICQSADSAGFSATTTSTHYDGICLRPGAGDDRRRSPTDPEERTFAEYHEHVVIGSRLRRVAALPSSLPVPDVALPKGQVPGITIPSRHGTFRPQTAISARRTRSTS